MALVTAIHLRGSRASQPAAATSNAGYVYCVTDEGNILERSSGSAWQAYSPTGSGSGTVTNTGTLTANKAIIGNGGVDVTVSALTGVIKQTAGVEAAATVNTDYLAPAAYMICGRLTTESGVPVSTSDRTAQATIYWTPYNGDTVPLYTGSAWIRLTFSEISLALSGLTSGKNYDVFVYNNAGTLALELSAAWTTDTARADALALQNGLFVKSGTTTRLWVGTLRTTGTTTAEDSAAKRFLWNAFNQVDRKLKAALETADSWTYTTATFRQANANAANQLAYVTGDAGVLIEAFARGLAGNGTEASVVVGIGVDSTSVNSADYYGMNAQTRAAMSIATYSGYPGLGYHVLPWLEYSDAIGTTTWYGDAGSATKYQTGIAGKIKN